MIRALPVLLALASIAAAPPPVRLALTGSYHGDDVSAKSGEHWLALTGDGKQFALRDVTIAVRRVHDDVVDEDESARTGKDVSIKPELDAIALIRGANLTAGPVVTAAAQLEIGRDESKPIAFGGGNPYVARVTCSTPGKQNESRCELRLEHDGVRQSVASFDGFMEDGKFQFAGEQPPKVIWAGDLDRDGRLDLLVDTTNHYNVSSIALFLSSAAAKGKLVGRAAVFSATGC